MKMQFPSTDILDFKRFLSQNASTIRNNWSSAWVVTWPQFEKLGHRDHGFGLNMEICIKMPSQQKPFSLYEDQLFLLFLSLLAPVLLCWHKKISPSQEFVSVLSGDLSQKLITICQGELIRCTFLARSQEVQTYDIQYPECVLTLFIVLFPGRKTLVSYSFFSCFHPWLGWLTL